MCAQLTILHAILSQTATSVIADLQKMTLGNRLSAAFLAENISQSLFNSPFLWPSTVLSFGSCQ